MTPKFLVLVLAREEGNQKRESLTLGNKLSDLDYVLVPSGLWVDGRHPRDSLPGGPQLLSLCPGKSDSSLRLGPKFPLSMTWES